MKRPNPPTFEPFNNFVRRRQKLIHSNSSDASVGFPPSTPESEAPYLRGIMRNPIPQYTWSYQCIYPYAYIHWHEADLSGNSRMNLLKKLCRYPPTRKNEFGYDEFDPNLLDYTKPNANLGFLGFYQRRKQSRKSRRKSRKRSRKR